jgi:hypothetical protein
MIIREGYLVPYIRLWKLEIGGGIFIPLFPLRSCGYIIKNRVTDELCLVNKVKQTYSSIGFRCRYFGIYIKWIHKG